MKNVCVVLAIFLSSCSIANCQDWIPMVVNTTGYVSYQYSVTNYYTDWRPINIPVVRYYPVQPQPVVQPIIFVQPRSPLCWWNHRPYYYIYPNVYNYVPYSPYRY
jgi:hypothetical protein